MQWFEFFLITLATFRLTRLLVYDKITTFIRNPFHETREELESDGAVVEVLYVKGKGIRKFIGELLSCHWCTGMWCAAFLYGGKGGGKPYFPDRTDSRGAGPPPFTI